MEIIPNQVTAIFDANGGHIENLQIVWHLTEILLFCVKLCVLIVSNYEKNKTNKTVATCMYFSPTVKLNIYTSWNASGWEFNWLYTFIKFNFSFNLNDRNVI